MFESEPWGNARVPCVSPAVLAYRGRRTIAARTALELRAPAGNRLARAVKTIEALVAGKIRPREDEPEQQLRTLEAMRTVFEAFLVVWTRAERPRRANPLPNERLRYLFEGADLPTADHNPKARSTQFELTHGILRSRR